MKEVNNRYLRKLEWENNILENTTQYLSTQLISSLKIHDQRWIDGIRNEIIFWWRYISERLNDDGFIYKIENGAQFQYENLFDNKNSPELDILDIGCAIAPDIGINSKQFQINLYPLDPLGTIYNQILDFYKIKYKTPILTGLAEEIPNIFSSKRFDFVHAKNSLDHCLNLPVVFKNILEITKPGGRIILQHFENEGLNQNYQDFHLWNITTESGSLKLWSQQEVNYFSPVEYKFDMSVDRIKKTKRNGNTYNFLTLNIVKNLYS